MKTLFIIAAILLLVLVIYIIFLLDHLVRSPQLKGLVLVMAVLTGFLAAILGYGIIYGLKNYVPNDEPKILLPDTDSLLFRDGTGQEYKKLPDSTMTVTELTDISFSRLKPGSMP